MPAPPDESPRARVRAHRWFAWVWAVPITAAGIVIWLGWRSVATRGPAITIAFNRAQGIQPGQTRIQHRGVDVGTVESLELTPDLSRVLVHARMSRSVEGYLNDHTHFYIVAPRVTAGGITGLSTIVSGSYIEISPGKGGASLREFSGLDEPPVLPEDTPGRSFTLETSDLGSLARGSPITYRGVAVGEVQGYTLAQNGSKVTVTAFIRSPYDELVHPETRFWNAGGVDMSVGPQGLRFRASSWQQLLAGGIAFENPREDLKDAPSPEGALFELYDNRRSAVRAVKGPQLTYLADFEGNLRGVGNGTPVELQGAEVGEVREAHLRYDSTRHTLLTRVTFSIDPQSVNISDMPHRSGADQRETAGDWLRILVSNGLRARVVEVSFLTGLNLIALDVVADAPAGRMERVGPYEKLPSTSSSDLTELLASARGVLQNLQRVTGGPELKHSLKSLDETLTHLNQLTQDVQPDLKALVRSLKDTADAAQGTLSAVQTTLGNGSAADSDLPRLMRELTQAARAVRGLADYLDRHPEALLRGRKEEEQ